MYVIILENFRTGGRDFKVGDRYCLHRSEKNRYAEGFYFYLTDERRSFSGGIPEYDKGKRLACTISVRTALVLKELKQKNSLDKVVRSL